MKSEKNNTKKKKSLSPKKIRKELILYLLQKYGNLQTKEISEILGHKARTIRRTLKKLEESDKVRSDKLGRSYIWSSSSSEEKTEGMMYF